MGVYVLSPRTSEWDKTPDLIAHCTCARVFNPMTYQIAQLMKLAQLE